ncbi:methyl-accepting chemotaxis protein [Patescibacteria group bacterium]|nr:methyl-accepting chemotaxis protein [Patescibacteria group bacterium]
MSKKFELQSNKKIPNKKNFEFRFDNFLFKNWKIKNKIIFIFFIVAVIYSLVSVYVIKLNVSKIIEGGTKMHIVHKLIMHQKESELLLRNYYLAEDKSALSFDASRRKKEFDNLILNYEGMQSDKEGIAIVVNLKKGSDNYFNLADKFIKLHTTRIGISEDLKKDYQLEKTLRSSILDYMARAKDSDELELYYILAYQSKEFLYQYKDQSYLEKWNEAFNNIENKNKEIVPGIIIDEYGLLLDKLGQFILESESINNQEIELLSQVGELEKLISQLQNQSEKINERNTDIFIQDLIIFGFVLLFFTSILIILLGYVVAYYISNPINKILKFAEKIGNDDFQEKIKVNSNDEIGKMAEVLNRALDKIQEARQVLEIKVKARTKRLQDLAIELDDKVNDRTAKIKEKVIELERFNNLAVNRELKMIELKNEIKELKRGICTIDKYDLNQEDRNIPQNCWEYWDCKKYIRENCEAYKTDSGKECWLVAAGHCPRSKERGVKDCQDCRWYKINNKIINNNKTI